MKQSSALVPSQSEKLPTNDSCVVSGHVERRDVNWKLRTRLDAVATMEVITGDVTARLFPVRGLPEPNVMANATIENAKIIVQAIVAPDDLRVVLARPIFLRDSVIPDGLTDRVVVSVDDGTMRVMFEIPGVEVLAETLPCSYFSVQRSKIDIGELVPRQKISALIRQTASISFDGLEVPLSRFNFLPSVYRTNGIAINDLGNGDDPALRQIQIEPCGATIIGKVLKSDIVGPSLVGHGTNVRCPNTGENHFSTGHFRLNSGLTCRRNIRLYVRSTSLLDEVGILKAGALFRVEGTPDGAVQSVVLSDGPVQVLPLAHFVVNVSDLSSCSPSHQDH
jgi:hypothetical protein